MNKYGQVAVNAAKLVEHGKDPKDAWEQASIEMFGAGTSSQSKGCPRNAFLGLYGGTGKNAEYAKKAVAYLKNTPSITVTPKELWELVTSNDGKAHNQQMNVVLTLYQAGYCRD